ncbi:hypothetical protein CUMW_119240 [Citrus unshiu]|nr:hypothetical protein CUMW_119240 [Citrus unshiu]
MGPWALLISLNEKCRSRRGRENETAAQTAVSLRILSAFPTGRHGFAVAITGAESIGKGLIRNGTVLVTFLVRCQCIVFRPFKGEILGAGVTMVNKLIPDDMELQTGDLPSYTTSDGSVKIQKDCELGLKIIGTQVDVTEIEKARREVGKQRADKHPVEAIPFRGEILGAAVTMVNKLIPDDMELQTGDLPNYTTSDGSLRLKIIGTRVDATEIEKA